ncbi:MAG: 50S ribosomal protein L11 methyltransferase [Flavobacteriales bacterium]
MKQEVYIRVRSSDIQDPDRAALWARHGIEEGAEGAEEGEQELILYFSAKEERAAQRFRSALEDEGYSCRTEYIADEDWNKRWEEAFRPVRIGKELVVRAPFHSPFSTYPYRIEVLPERAFGTGHHPTTYLMLEKLLRTPLEGKRVLDMGCGTGILAILCEMRGAENILAIDNDSWAIASCKSTLERNGCSRVRVEHGTELPWKGTGFDVILGNIQREPLLGMIPQAARALRYEGELLLSGLRTDDVPPIEAKCEEVGLKRNEQKASDGWVMLEYIES